MSKSVLSLGTERSQKDSVPALHLALSPSGHVYLYQDSESDERISSDLALKLERLFLRESNQEGSLPKDSMKGLLRLGIMPLPAPLPSSIGFWQTIAQAFLAEVIKVSRDQAYKIEESFELSPPLEDLKSLIDQAPFMRGLEYLTVEVMQTLWLDLCQALKQELVAFQRDLQQYLAAYNPAWNKVGRVCFHLAENKADPTHPFAFLATYTVHGSSSLKVQHLPLGQALKEYSKAEKRASLLSLLRPVQKAAEHCPLVKKLLETKDLFYPQAWQAKAAYEFLKAIPLIEASGVMVRVPNWWTPKNPPRPQVNIAIGNAPTDAVGVKALLDFQINYCLPRGEQLTEEEWQTLLNTEDPLVQIKGQWVEVDHHKMTHVLSHWKVIERQVKREGLTFSEGLRLLAGMPSQQETAVSLGEVREWSTVREGDWLQETLTHLRHPNQEGDKTLKATLKIYLKAELRPYQEAGVEWLWWLYSLKLGGCLADDMGLGKTIQVLSLLLLIKHHSLPSYSSSPSQPEFSEQPLSHPQLQPRPNPQPHLLIVPASLLANWQSEIKRFAPSLTLFIAHQSFPNKRKRSKKSPHEEKTPDAEKGPDLSGIDVVMTTYGHVYRMPWVDQQEWNLILLDEAQSIKNPTTKQALAIKKLKSQVRLILTGTPIENRLLDLWSLFDFIAPGLLGSIKDFSAYGRKAQQKAKEEDIREQERRGEEGEQEEQQETTKGEGHFYAAVRHLISPYLLRRLKSDKSIIADLPDKTEMEAYCFLTKRQAILYQKSVEELAQRLHGEEIDEIKRRGLVLSYLMRLKQICNHPSQWLGHGCYEEEESGKFIRLKELCQSIALKQEKVLVFTQFKEIIPALQETLNNVFGQPGLMLHGQTAVKERMKLVEAFQQDLGPPFFVLSLKAGGTGLNLTRASHVIHFDRWWNPAVENQATDRAYRIGQKKNVLVHKFICQGTLEEKIDSLIRSKKTLANKLLTQEEELHLTELTTPELLNLLSLDIHRALEEK